MASVTPSAVRENRDPASSIKLCEAFVTRHILMMVNARGERVADPTSASLSAVMICSGVCLSLPILTPLSLRLGAGS